MNVGELNEFLKNKNIDKPRYYCNLDELWFVLVVNSKPTIENYSLCLLLDGPLSDSPLTIKFTSISNGWNIDPNYNQLTATAMMRQLDRCLDMTALVTENLIAIKFAGVKTIAWTKGKIDNSKIYNIYKQSDEFQLNSLIHDKIVATNNLTNQLKYNLDCDERLAKFRRQVHYRMDLRKNTVINLETLGWMDKNEQELILAERYFFEICLSNKINKTFIDLIKKLIDDKI
jgi:hypothetical protein